jgi:PAS domain S-box-containing protein
MTGEYIFYNIILSVLVASITGYTALTVADRMHQAEKATSRYTWLAVGSIAMGLGFLAMHFPGLMAYSLNMVAEYSIPTAITILSVVPAIIGSAIALNLLSANTISWKSNQISAFFLAACITLMHYIGIEAIRMPSILKFDTSYFLLSIISAHLFASLALHMKYVSFRRIIFIKHYQDITRATIMGLSFYGIHYTALGATRLYSPDSFHSHENIMPDKTLLITLIAIIALLLFIIITIAYIDKKIRRLIIKLISRQKQVEQDLKNRTIQLLEKQKVLFELSKENFYDQDMMFSLIIKADAEQLRLKRVSIWLYNQERTELICKALYHHGEIKSEKLILKAEDYIRYFQALEKYGRISANDANNDPNTNEFSENYLKPLGITSMMDVPILLQGKMVGIVCHEHIGPEREWTVEDENFANSISDLCALVLAADERKQTEEALIKSEEKYRTLIESSPFCIHQIDSEGRLISMNRAGLKMLDMKNEVEIIGTPYIESVCNEDREQILDLMDLAYKGNYQEFEFHGINGNVFRSNFVPIFNSNNKVDRLLGITQDITKYKQQEKQLAQSQKMQVVGQLTGGIAHDFNNMLASILGYSELAKEDILKIGDEKLIGYLDSVIHASNRASKLIEEMLLFSQPGDMSAKVILIDNILLETMNLLKGSLPSSIEVNVNINKNIPAILIDPIQLEQIIINLCVNARDAMNGIGQLNVDVQTIHITENQKHIPDVLTNNTSERIDICFCTNKQSESHMGDYVEISIKDSGCGIAKEQLARIFEPFYTTKDIGKGTGMGLATIHGIMQGANGHIIVESKENKGAIFRLLFKVDDIAKIDKPTEIKEDEIAAYHNNATILLVDDESILIKYMSDMLSKHGYKITNSINGEDALKQFRDAPDNFDLIITDQTMPKMTGDKLSREVLKIRPDIPVILHTGYSDLVNESEIKAIGIRAYLKKPANSKQILDMINNVLSEVN